MDSCDYPDFAEAAAKAVANGECDKGIVMCTTGIGISIAANKVKGIRCALLSDVMSARMTREHNDTNMMSIGAAVVGKMLALEIIDTWLGTEFSGEAKHQRRIDKITAIEQGYFHHTQQPPGCKRIRAILYIMVYLNVGEGQ